MGRSDVGSSVDKSGVSSVDRSDVSSVDKSNISSVDTNAFSIRGCGSNPSMHLWHPIPKTDTSENLLYIKKPRGKPKFHTFVLM